MQHQQSREVSVVVDDELRLMETLRQIKDEGYNVVDILPELGTLIVLMTPEQLDDITEIGRDIWTTTVMDRWSGNLFN